MGCAEFSIDVPGSFNFNYDYSTGSAVNPSIGLRQGISCQNCFAFLGAGLLAIAEYRSGSVYFQISVGGGAGFSANLAVTGQHSMSGSTIYQLLGEASRFSSFPIGGGLSLEYKVGGLTALLSGSGGFTGSARFGAAVSASATISVLYDGNSVSFPNKMFVSNTPPYYNSQLSGSFSLRCDLTGTEKFQLSYNGFISAAFSVKLSGYVQYNQMISFATTSASVYSTTNSTIRRLSETDTMPITFQTGDLVHIVFTYKDFHVNEEIVLFIGTADEHPIMRRKFFLTDSSGSLEALWAVPWNSLLCGMSSNYRAASRIIVRASNMLTHSTETESFTLSMFSDSHTIFSTPSLSAIVPTEEPYEVTWQAGLLKFFQPDTSSVAHWYGDEKVVELVNLEIVAENVSASGIVMGSLSSLLTNNSVLNIGSAVITIPKHIYGKGDRFYLKVSSIDTLNIFGWSRYFFLNEVGSSTVSTTSSAYETLNASTTARRVLRESTMECPSSLVSGSTAGGNLGAIKILGATVATPSVGGSFTMYGPSSLCVNGDFSAATSAFTKASSPGNHSVPSLMPLASVYSANDNYYAYYNTYYYYGNENGANSKNPSPSPTVAASAYPTFAYSSHAVIIHRYSFNDSANDSVGGSSWNGVLKEGATIVNGALNLQWTGSNQSYPHVQLPYGITEGYPILTIELWAKVQNNNCPWTHFFAFASKINSNQNSYGLRLTGNSLITQVTGTSSQSTAVGTISASKLSMHWTHITVVYNPETTNITLYVNGSFVGQNKAKANPPSVGITAYNTIGASTMTVDLGFIGQINEFRIWAGELNSSEVKNSYAEGPDAMLPVPLASTNAILAPTSAPQADYSSPPAPALSIPSATSSSKPSIGPTTAALASSVPSTTTPSLAPFAQPSVTLSASPLSSAPSAPSFVPSHFPTSSGKRNASFIVKQILNSVGADHHNPLIDGTFVGVVSFILNVTSDSIQILNVTELTSVPTKVAVMRLRVHVAGTVDLLFTYKVTVQHTVLPEEVYVNRLTESINSGYFTTLLQVVAKNNSITALVGASSSYQYIVTNAPTKSPTRVPSNKSPTNSPTVVSPGGIAGIVIGGVVFLILIIVGVLFVLNGSNWSPATGGGTGNSFNLNVNPVDDVHVNPAKLEEIIAPAKVDDAVAVTPEEPSTALMEKNDSLVVF